MFLRELENEVLENVALSLLIVRHPQRDFRILARFDWRELRLAKGFASDFEF